jgi:hypothetical protein
MISCIGDPARGAEREDGLLILKIGIARLRSRVAALILSKEQGRAPAAGSFNCQFEGRKHRNRNAARPLI